MIIEIRKTYNGEFVYTQPLNSDIAWDNEVAYYDCLNDILYASEQHTKADDAVILIKCRQIYKDYQNEKK